MTTRCLAWIAALLLLSLPALATDRFYPDRHAVSDDGRYRVEARSPDNRDPKVKPPFASRFEYRLIETGSGTTLWALQANPDEPSCSALFVDNDGWTVIEDAWDGLSFLSPKGVKTGHVDILEKGMTQRERKDYVHDTTAGPMWQGLSLWYFLQADGRRLFVIRPWWGRPLVADVGQGTWVKAGKSIREACVAHDRAWTLRSLRQAIATRAKWEKECCAPEAAVALKAAFLAGKLGLAEALPMLQSLQDSTYSASSTTGFGDYKPAVGGVDPSSWTTLTLRQAVHQSLRRLGARPEPFPCTRFKVQSKDEKERPDFPPADQKRPRDGNVAALKKGMKPEEVIGLVGAPDFNDTDEWSYDIDGPKPFRLTLIWGKDGLVSIATDGVPGWKTDDWDRELAY